MLGMMNSPSDSVEFYATNRKASDDVAAADSDLRKFSEIKQKDVVTYTEDGRKMINGKLVTETDAPSMWSSALLRGRIRTITATPATEKAKKQEREKVRRNSKKLGKTIAVVASLQHMSSVDGCGESEATPKPVEITPIAVVGSSSPPK